MKTISDPSLRQEWLQRYQLNQVFPENCLEKLQLIIYEPGEVICQQGRDLKQISYFLQGSLKIVHSLENGVDMILSLQKEAGLLGEIELMLEKACVSSVIAVETSWVVQLPLSNYKKKLLSSSLFLRHVGEDLAEKLHYNNRLTPTHLHYSLQERLATHILSQIRHNPVFRPKLTQLAESFGVSYRHLQRVLKQMVDDGWLSKEKRQYTVLKPQELSKRAIKEAPFD